METFFMIKNIRHSIVNGLFGDKTSLKAVALLLFIYHKTGQNVVKRWSYNKIAKYAGVHHRTIEKRLATLSDMGLAQVEGSSLVFRSVVSKHADRNINIGDVKYGTLKDVEKSLYAILLCLIQTRKEFCKRTIRQAHESRQFSVVKKARNLLRKYGWGSSYCERGLSYKGIARKLGISVKTAFDYVRFAVERGFILLENHFNSTLIRNVNHYPIPGFTFTTSSYGFSVSANTYTILSHIFNIKKGTTAGLGF